MNFFLLYHFGYPQYPSRLPQFQILWRIFSDFDIEKKKKKPTHVIL